MPVNYQQIQSQVKTLGEQAVIQERRIQSLRQQAFELLHQHAENLDELIALVNLAHQANPNLRCAVPAGECLTTAHSVPPLSEPIVILAADGSQINPDRHAAVEFGVINTGAIRIQPNQPIPPTELIRSKLLFGDELRPDGKPITDETVALLRDLSERELLAELAASESLPVVTLTDGPLELFREKETGAAMEYKARFQQYLKALDALASISAVTAGYVDRPGSDLVVRLLELTLLPEAEFAHKAGRHHPLEGPCDADLYLALLQPGQRSPIFAIQSPSAGEFKDILALHFFYLNVGRPDQPFIARVELPRWVVERPEMLNRLHAALIQQCQVIQTRPFPYAIHRAHEVAVVTSMEKTHLEELIIKTLIEQGFQPPHVSNKQFLKNNYGKRTRYSI